MDSGFKFYSDKILQDKAYPALATWPAQPYTQAWRQFRDHWPYTVPCELHEHCATHGYPYQLSDQTHGMYCIGLGFFDFSIDYFALIPAQVFEQRLLIVFYYHEGDNPYRIKQRLDQLCQQHDLDVDCYRFVSGNTRADHIKNFVWFPDHELLYWHRNREVPATPIHLDPRPYLFTVLNRTHKWWRATVMADLQRNGVLRSSQWSYNTQIDLGDDFTADNPIEIDTLDLRDCVETFMRLGPHTCDNLSAEQHNNHQLHVPELYTNSYCHLVIETHFDADQSGGAFLTEKTFKAIKHGQPFIIIGCPGSLQALRELGYRTFDHVIDNSYDLETDNTRRWQKILTAIHTIRERDPGAWFQSCLPDLQHNQQHFLASKYQRLDNLYQTLMHRPELINPDTYCSLPFAGYDSRVKHVCCWTDPKNPAHRFENFSQCVESHVVKRLQRDLQVGIKNPLCQTCWDHESANVTSMRQVYLKDKTRQDFTDEINNKRLKHLVIDSGNICNLSCRTCFPESSSGLIKEFQSKSRQFKLEPFPTQIKHVDLDWLKKENLDHIESINILGGEPFQNLNHLDLLEHIIALGRSSQCQLIYSTNATVPLNDRIKNIFGNFQSVGLSLSIDAVGQQFEYIRTNGNWEFTALNVKNLIDISKSYSNISLRGHPTISCLNILYLDDLFEWYSDNNLDWTVVFCDHPKEYSFDIFNDQQKQILIDKLEKSKFDTSAIIRQIQQSKFDRDSLQMLYKQIEFTKEYKNLDAHVYLPALMNLLQQVY